MNYSKPYFSIVVPTYERPIELNKCLQSISELDYPKNRYEVIVVDDGSRLQPDKIINSYARDLSIRLYLQSHSGPAKARNTGVSKAKGEFIAFTDDDCELDKNWLQAFGEEFMKIPDRLLGGHTLNSLTDNLYSTASQTLIEYLYSYYNKDPIDARFFTSNNIAISAGLFNDIGGFDEKIIRATAEDREFCDRLHLLGYNMSYVPEAIVFHSHNLTFYRFFKLHFKYGRGAYYFRKSRKLRGQNSIKIEPISFYINMLRYPMIKKTNHNNFLMSIFFVISQISNAFGFFWENFYRRIKNNKHSNSFVI